MKEPEDERTIDFLKAAIGFGHDFTNEFNRPPEAQDYADHLAEGDLTEAEQVASMYFNELSEFFSEKKPKELGKLQFHSLKLRWGFIDGEVHRLSEVAETESISLEDLFSAETNLIQRLGIRMKETKTVQDRWKRK